MTSSFTAYIDESGDEGFVFLPGERGSSRWLVLSAVVFRKTEDLEAVRVMRAVRLLLERVSWLCRDFRKGNEGDGSCELVFSNRSVMSYEDLRDYLTRLKDKPSSDVRIDWDAIRPQQVRAVNHDQLAGLQIADAVASSLFFAVNLTQYGEAEDRYFRMLRPTVYRDAKSGELGYGLKFWPGSVEAFAESMGHLTSFLPAK